MPCRFIPTYTAFSKSVAGGMDAIVARTERCGTARIFLTYVWQVIWNMHLIKGYSHNPSHVNLSHLIGSVSTDPMSKIKAPVTSRSNERLEASACTTTTLRRAHCRCHQRGQDAFPYYLTILTKYNTLVIAAGYM